MLLSQEVGDGVAVLRLSGVTTGTDAARLVRTVRRVQAAQPRGVVVDLTGAEGLCPEAADALASLAAPQSESGASALCLCGTPGLQSTLPGVVLHPSLDAALAALTERRAAPRHVVPIEHSPHGPAQARRAVQAQVEGLGLDDEGDDLLLVVSEMVTNAVRHAEPPVELQIAATADRVVVAVADGSPAPPVARHAGEDAEGGRGMGLVDLLCSEHGVRADPPGKKVWAAVPRRRDAPS